VLIRASIGTLAKLGLASIKMSVEPMTAYLLQYSEYGCWASCTFCAQSRTNSVSKEYLARVLWPVVEFEKLVEALKQGKFSRICVESVLKPRFFEELVAIIGKLKESVSIPLSVAITPIPRSELKTLRRRGVDTLGIGLDATTPSIFEAVRKPFTWSTYMEFIVRGVEVFGRDNVVVHVIAGLGESLEEAVNTMKKLYSIGARVALFRFTPITVSRSGNISIDICKYRLLQLANEMLRHGYDISQYLEFKGDQVKQLRRIPIDILDAVLTSGCPGCNRPFYNESPRGPIFNYPSKELAKRDEAKIVEELRRAGIDI